MSRKNKNAPGYGASLDIGSGSGECHHHSITESPSLSTIDKQLAEMRSAQTAGDNAAYLAAFTRFLDEIEKGAIPKLSKRQAWLLIRRINQDMNGGAA